MKKLLKTEEGCREAITKILNECENKEKELENESKQMMKASAVFATFLKQNAALTYNRGFERHLELLIENAKKEDYQERKIQALETMMKEFLVEVKILDNPSTLDKNISSEEVERSAEELFKMKINGVNFKECFDTNNKSMQRNQLIHPDTIIYLNHNDRSKKSHLKSIEKGSHHVKTKWNLFKNLKMG